MIVRFSQASIHSDGRRLPVGARLHPAIGSLRLQHDQGPEEQPAALGGPHPGAGGGASVDPPSRRADLLRRRRLDAATGTVPRGALGGAETRRSPAHQVARPPAQLRLDPRLGRDAAVPDPRSPRPLVGADDGALRASRGVTDGRVHAPALCRFAGDAHATGPAKWAPGGPEHPRLA